MERVFLQVKRIIDNIDFNKIYDGFKRNKFLIKYNDYLYGLKELIKYQNDFDEIEIDGDKYVIYDLVTNEINIKKIVISIVCKMFDKQFKIKRCNEEKIKYLVEKKDSDYYILKYQLNLLSVNILKGNKSLINDYKSIKKVLSEKYHASKYEQILENNVSVKEYIYLELIKMFKPEEFQYEIRKYYDTLEDPCKLLNYINYIFDYSIINLLVKNIIDNYNRKEEFKEVDKPLFSFNKLIDEKNKHTKKILMHKMIHAKKTLFKGTIIDIDFNNVLECDNLFYLPNSITFLYNGKIITKKGDYILKINENLEIIEGYECFSLEKILA